MVAVSGAEPLGQPVRSIGQIEPFFRARQKAPRSAKTSAKTNAKTNTKTNAEMNARRWPLSEVLTIRLCEFDHSAAFFR